MSRCWLRLWVYVQRFQFEQYWYGPYLPSRVRSSPVPHFGQAELITQAPTTKRRTPVGWALDSKILEMVLFGSS